MKLIQIFALSVVVLYLTQENKTNGFKIIKIPIYTVKGIIWITIKVPAKFVWNILRFPTKIIINLAWILSKRPIKMITPQYLQYTINQLVEEYEIERKKRKKEKSIRHRMKVSIKKGISKMNNGLERFDRKVFWVGNKISSRIKKINWGKKNKRKNAHPKNRNQLNKKNQNIQHR